MAAAVGYSRLDLRYNIHISVDGHDKTDITYNTECTPDNLHTQHKDQLLRNRQRMDCRPLLKPVLLVHLLQARARRTELGEGMLTGHDHGYESAHGCESAHGHVHVLVLDSGPGPGPGRLA